MALSDPLFQPKDLLLISSVRRGDPAKLPVDPAKAETEAASSRAPKSSVRVTALDGEGNRYKLAPVTSDAGEAWSIVSCEPTTADLRVPAAYDDKPIVAVESGAFQNLPAVRTIAFPDTVTSIGTNAFVDDESLERLILPAMLDRFDTYWLRGCTALTHLVLPGRLRRLRQGLLEYCPIKTLVIGAELETIDLGFFNHSVLESVEIDPANSDLATDGAVIYTKDATTLIAAAVHQAHVIVPDGCERIARKAFFFDETLTTLELPATLVEIEGYAFSHTSLTRFEAPPHLKTIGPKAFFRAQSLTEASLNDELESIGDEAFAQTALPALTIPASVLDLGKRIVADTPVVVSGPEATLKLASGNPRYRLSADGALYSEEELGRVLTEALDLKRRFVTVDLGTIMIGYRAFVRHTHLEAVTLPEGLRIIGESAFRGCTALTEINFPSTLERIEAEAFLDTRVAALRLPAVLQFIGRQALITRGGNRATRPPSLKSVEVDPANERFFMASGLLCERLAGERARAIVYVGPEVDVAIPAYVTDLEDYSFAGVVGLRALRFHKHIRHLGASALAIGGPVPLIEIELPEALAREARRTHLTVDIPRNYMGARTLTLATTTGRIDAPFLRRLVDNVILTLADVGERARYSLPRLADPVFLDPAYDERFRRFLAGSLLAVACRFAKTSYWEGFESLMELGFLNADTITDVIDAVNDAGYVEATSYLLQIKRTRLQASTLDFEL